MEVLTLGPLPRTQHGLIKLLGSGGCELGQGMFCLTAPPADGSQSSSLGSSTRSTASWTSLSQEEKAGSFRRSSTNATRELPGASSQGQAPPLSAQQCEPSQEIELSVGGVACGSLSLNVEYKVQKRISASGFPPPSESLSPPQSPHRYHRRPQSSSSSSSSS